MHTHGNDKAMNVAKNGVQRGESRRVTEATLQPETAVPSNSRRRLVEANFVLGFCGGKRRLVPIFSLDARSDP